MTGVRTAFALLTTTLLACGGQESGSGSWKDWVRKDNAYAQRFQVWARGEDRLVLVFGHGGARDTAGSYWITDAPLGSPPPGAPSRLNKGSSRVAVGSTTHVPYVSALGRVGSITACAHSGQVRDTAFQRLVGSGSVREIAAGDGLDRELLLTLDVQLLFAYPFGRGEGSTVQGLGIPTVEVSEYLEEHPLGRAEWLRFFGVIFGEERRADSLFAGIRERYESIREDSATTGRPTVLFGSVWDGQWWVPPGNSYMARLIEDAGGRYVFADREGDGNIAVDMETMITLGGSADYWGMIAQITDSATEEDFTQDDARLKAFRSVQRQHLFMGNTREEDLFGQALLEPDIVLGSLRSAMHPGGYYPGGYKPKYFGAMFYTPPAPHIRTERSRDPQ